MLKTLRGIVLAAGFALAGCGGAVLPDLPNLTVPTAQQVSAAAVTACGFLPDASVVEALLNANNTITSVTALAQQICNAVIAANGTAKGRLGGAIPVLNGVRITGHFVASARHQR